MTECLFDLADRRYAGVSFIVASCSARARVASALHSAWRCASAVGNPNCHGHSQTNTPHVSSLVKKLVPVLSEKLGDDTKGSHIFSCGPHNHKEQQRSQSIIAHPSQHSRNKKLNGKLTATRNASMRAISRSSRLASLFPAAIVLSSLCV